MKKIYIVTSESFSDYQINAIFSTKELANSYIDMYLPNKSNNIEEWDIDADTIIDHIEAGRKPFKVSIRNNGNVETVESIPIDDINSSLYKLNTPQKEFHSLNDGEGGVMDVYCIANNINRAKKIANKVLAMVLENNQWPTLKTII